MCGIVGIISAFSNGFSSKEADAFEQLLYVDALRGVDATGIMYVKQNTELNVIKDAIPSSEFLRTKEWSDAKRDIVSSARFAFGHNRAATRGAKVAKNAHPFIVDDNIVLMQNGTYVGDHKHLKDTDVDTEAVAHVISETKDIEKALQKINAAYALVWYNVEEEALYMIRNTQRPLYYVETQNGGFMFASEWGFLTMVMSRNDITAKGKIHELSPGNLCKVTWKNRQVVLENTEIDHHYKGVVGTAPFRVTHHGGTTTHSGTTKKYSFVTGHDSIKLKHVFDMQTYTSQSPDYIPSSTYIPEVFPEDYSAADHTKFSAELTKDVNEQLCIEPITYKPASAANNCWWIFCRINAGAGDVLDQVPCVLGAVGSEEDIMDYISTYQLLGGGSDFLQRYVKVGGPQVPRHICMMIEHAIDFCCTTPTQTVQ